MVKAACWKFTNSRLRCSPISQKRVEKKLPCITVPLAYRTKFTGRAEIYNCFLHSELIFHRWPDKRLRPPGIQDRSLRRHVRCLSRTKAPAQSIHLTLRAPLAGCANIARQKCWTDAFLILASNERLTSTCLILTHLLQM